MAERFQATDPVRCWDILTEVLSYGHTIPYVYKKDPPTYYLSEGVGGWGYWDNSCAEYLLDDIQFALFEQGLEKIRLTLSGKEDGPICSFWHFTFTKEGLVEAYGYYNDD